MNRTTVLTASVFVVTLIPPFLAPLSHVLWSAPIGDSP
jgi:hypothetical protein